MVVLVIGNVILTVCSANTDLCNQCHHACLLYVLLRVIVIVTTVVLALIALDRTSTTLK